MARKYGKSIKLAEHRNEDTKHPWLSNGSRQGTAKTATLKGI